MTTTTAARAGFRPGRALVWWGGFVAFGATLSGLYAVSGLGVGCPFRQLTGWDCPLCGGTRLGAALMHGDVAAAFAYNPLVFVGLAVLTVLGAAWVLEAVGGPKLRPPAPVRVRLLAVSPTRWLIIGSVVAVVYVLLRNLL